MRRSPQALECERKVAALISTTNQAQALSPAEQEFRELVEDPAFHTGRSSSRRRYRPPISKSTAVRKPQSDREVYDTGLARMRRLHSEQHELLFRRVLHELFTEIARAGAAGPILPEDIELPDPISKRRLCFNPDGTGRIVDSPARARFEELYSLLDGLDLTRVRECGSCQQLFWAWRTDQFACSKPCANRYRASKFYYRTKQLRMASATSTTSTRKTRKRGGRSKGQAIEHVPKRRK